MRKSLLKLISVMISAAVMMCFASCKLNNDVTIETDIDIDVKTGTGDEETVVTILPETTVTDNEITGEPTSDGSHHELYVENQNEIPSPDWVTALPQAQDPDTKQLLIVAGMGMNSSCAYISMHERDAEGRWIQILTTPGYVGVNGMCPDADHVEGCGQTPVGIYRFNAAFGIADDPGCAIPYLQVNDDLYWSSDMRDGMHYNEMVDINECPDLDTGNSEHIVHYEYEYQYCLNISFNEECTPGRGSAIFLHCFGLKKPYTGGCVAVPEYSMIRIMQRVDPDCVVVIDTVDVLGYVF